MNPMDIARTVGKAGPEMMMQARGGAPGSSGDPLQIFRQLLAESGMIPPEQVAAIPDETLMQVMQQMMDGGQVGGPPGSPGPMPMPGM